MRGKDGQEILWHMGREDDPRSAGCQTMPPEEWRRFLHDLDLKEDQPINYTLVQEDSSKGNVVWTPPEEGVTMKDVVQWTHRKWRDSRLLGPN